MSRRQSTLYTKDQAQNFLNLWGADQPLPRKGQMVVVAWPCKGEIETDLAELELTGLNATYGGKLYRLTQSSRAGRAFDENVQESHVVAFLVHQAEMRQQANLAQYRQFQQS